MSTATHQVRYNRSTVHITNLAIRTKLSEHAGSDDRDLGYVEYAPDSHCSALTRSGRTMAIKSTNRTEPGDQPGRVRHVSTPIQYSTPAEALKAAALHASVYGGKVCAKCRDAAEAH